MIINKKYIPTNLTVFMILIFCIEHIDSTNSGSKQREFPFLIFSS